MKKLSLKFLFIILSVCSFGQSIDKFYNDFKNAGNAQRRQVGEKLVKWLYNEDLLTDTTLFLNKNLSDKAYERDFYNLTLRYLFLLEHYELTYEAAQTLLKLSILANDTTNLIHAKYFLGFSCQRMGKMDEGLIHAKACYEMCLTTQDEEMMSSVLNNIANIYLINGQDSIAVIYFQKTIAIERKLDRTLNLAIRLGNITKAYMNLGKLDEALSSVSEGLKLDREKNLFPDKIAIRLHQMCEVYMAMKNYEKAKECAIESFDYFKEAESKYYQSIVLNTLGEIEYAMNNRTKAENYYVQALSFAEEIQNNLLVQNVCHNLYQLFRNSNHEQSLFYFERSVALKDSLFHKENQVQLNDFRVRYETAEKELEIERQKAEITHQKARLYLFMGGLLTAGLLMVLLIYILIQRTKRNRELREINALKDKFFGIISHDLKNPTIAQRNALQLLAENANQFEPEILSQYYVELLKSADYQVELLYNLLNWAQVQTGRMSYEPTTFDIIEALRSEIAMIQNMAKAKNITLNVQMPEKAITKGDRNMIISVIRNLLTNAIKFTDKGGEVTLDISPCRDVSRNVSTETAYTISISDTGTGMNAEQLQNLFRIDKQQSKTGTAGEQGSGLGLIVCKEFIEKHGSNLHVESAQGKGSRFWFEVKTCGREVSGSL